MNHCSYRFAYTDFVKLSGGLEALQIHKACKTYDIKSLMNISMSHMEKNVTCDDLWFVLDNLQGMNDAQKNRILAKADQVRIFS